MKKEIRSGIIGAIVTFIIATVFQYAGVFFFGDDGTIEVINNKLNNGSYQTIIAIKNMSKDEYLKNIEIKINDDINIDAITKDGEKLEEFTEIYFEKITPNSVSVLNIISTEEINIDKLIIIKNGSNISISEFNKATNYKTLYLILICSYTIINFIIGICLDHMTNNKCKKAIEEVDEKCKEAKKDNEKTQKELEKIENKLKLETRKLSVNHTIYVKDLNQLEKENRFLKQMILNKYSEKLSKEELEKFLNKEIKKFHRKNIKYLTYDDIYNMFESKLEQTKQLYIEELKKENND